MTNPSNGEWTSPELARNIIEIKSILGEIRREQQAQRSEFVHRDLREADQKSLDAYKQQVAVDIVNIEAEQARIRKDVRDSQRYAMSLAVTIAGVIAGIVATVVNATGLGVS